jgi:type IV pilus assembly protein PilY1
MMKNNSWIKKLVWLGAMIPCLVQAEFLDLATMPLQTSGSSDVKPNLMFVLDNSGSMGWDYSPDWANSASDWLKDNSDYNTQYYDPEVIYSPPLTYQGVNMANQTGFGTVSNEVNDQGNTKNGTSDLRNSAFYYAFIPGEYCTTPSLTSCVISKVPTGIYTYPADIRWCNSSTAAARRTLSGSQRCQKIRNASATVNDSNTYTFLRRPIATYRLTLTKSSNNATVQSIKINNIEILSQSVSASSFDNSNDLAASVLSAMCRTSLSGNCNLSGTTVTRSSNVLTIDTPAGDPVNTAAPIQVTMSGGTFSAQLATDTTNDIPGSMVYVKITSSISSYTAPGLATKGVDRTDCAGSTCTYNEEMTNFSNWWAYYRTRMQSMKTAASQAFKSLDSRYRVGLVTINNPSSNYLAIAPFNASQKQSWYEKLFAVSPSGGTPLRTALSSVGRHFAGKKTLGNDDPVQYACQSNFTLLTTDGYWNDTANPVRANGSTAIGNLDGGSTPRPQLDSSNKSNTLADVSKYFYDTDIRDSSLSNCTGALGSSVCGTANDYPKQNIVTMTLGLGIDGTLVYTEDYKNQIIGDFRDVTTGAKNWPDPTATEDGTRIDDLWHAAVNSNSTYYSASNPKLLRESLAKGLSEIKSLQGAAAAAAASSLAPTDGDNFQYVASYQTVKWTGNLEARTVNVKSLETSESAVWCAENVSATSCTSPAVETRITGNGSTSIYCKTTSSNQSNCDGLGGKLGSELSTNESSSCYVQISGSCTGRLQTQVANNSRKIYFNSNNALVSFTGDNLPALHRTALTNGYLALSQMQGLPASDPRISDANKVNKLVDYLRGNKTYEDISLNTVGANRLFRERQATLGDVSQSRPAYFKASNMTYLDAGYKAYRDAAVASRLPAVFVGANDGMLHAFNANTGDELWAFVPTPVISNLANLADKEYGANYHTNYVNGSPTVADVCVSGCSGSGAVWRTILVSGLNAGGRGYFALDVTNPAVPTLLWEFNAQNLGAGVNLGYTFGNPLITKMQDGRWVVLLTSGYNNGTYARKLNDGSFVNNSPVGDGGGYVYVVDAGSGAVLKVLATGEGSSANPSGLAKITAYADQLFENNTAVKTYAGDLNGNVWRFDINTNAVTKIATLRDAGGNAQKLTTQPVMVRVGKNIAAIVGTGKFLEVADLTNTPQNSIYTFKDGGQTTAIGRSQLISLALSGDRTVASSAAVNFNTGYGWFLDFPPGERVNLDPKAVSGVMLLSTLVPNSEACSGAGYGFLNFFNYEKGGSMLPSGLVSERLTTPAVGFNLVYDQNNVPHVLVTGSDDPTPRQINMDEQIFGKGTGGPGEIDNIFKRRTNGSYGTKQSWHELIQ